MRKSNQAGKKAALTRSKNFANASPKEKEKIIKKRSLAAKKAAITKSNQRKKIKTPSGKSPIMIQAGHSAGQQKRKNEGLSKPQDKKEYYDVMLVYAKRSGYSRPTCVCCKNTDWKFLVFDHIKNRSIDHKGKSGIAMARLLKNNKYPTGIQILCHNCNTGKEIFGGVKCPHHLSDKALAKLSSVGLPSGKILRK